MNDILLNSKKIGRYMGERQRAHVDRAYTTYEIFKIIAAADIRMRVVISLMASSGMRIGAIPSLKIRHLRYINDYKLYQITVYEGHSKAYYAYCTPECAAYLNSYIEYRERCGEKITPDSPIIREQFDCDDVLFAKRPRHITLSGLKKTIDRLLFRAGVQTVVHRTENQTKVLHKEVARLNGFRKFANTQMVRAKVNPVIKEMLLGHRTGLDDNYYRPSQEEVLQEYLKAVDLLSMSPTG
jgi:integrase